MNHQIESTPHQQSAVPGQMHSSTNSTDAIDGIANTGSPSALRGDIYLTLHTRTAIRVMRGRRANRKRDVAPILGLYHFGSRMRDIYRAAAEDDPYADRTLVHTERRFEAAENKLKELIRQLQQRLERVRANQMEVEECLSMQPRRFRIKTPRYGAQGARLIGILDKVVRLAYTANHVNQMTRREMKQFIDSAAHEVRSAFYQQEQYKYLALTRDDIRQQTQRWGLALEQMGKLEAEFLKAETKPKYGPAIRAQSMISTTFMTPEQRKEIQDPEAHSEIEIEELKDPKPE